MRSFLHPFYHLVVLCVLMTSQHILSQTTVTITTNGTWTVPAGVTSINLYLWGGGGAGGGATGTTANWRNGGGGGGGACSVNLAVAVSAGQVWTVTVGSGGTGSSGAGGAGGQTTFVLGGTTYSAAGGTGGAVASGSSTGTAAGGAGGGAAGSTGTVHNGGTGSTADNSSGVTGTGGGGGGSTAAGTSPANSCGTSGTGGTGTYPGGNGGYNGNCSSGSNNTGVAGTVPGGGGSGNNDWTTAHSGGAGGAGEVILTYTAAACSNTLPFSQNFDAVWTIPTSLLNGACAWSGAIGAGGDANNQWQRDDDVTSWTSGLGTYAPAYTSASHSARFHTYDAPNATTGDLISPTIDFSPAGTKTLTFQYINPETGSNLDVYLSTDNGVTYGASLLTLGNSNNWGLQTISLGASVSTTCKIKFRATSDYGSYDLGIDDVNISAPPAGPPTTQALNLTFSGADCHDLTISWTNGNGTGRYVSMNTSNTFTAPSNGTPPATPNTVWANAGQQIVFDGSGTSVTVSGLAPGTLYWFKVFEYNGSGASINYCVVAGANNPLSQSSSAIVAAPTTSASAVNFSATTCSQTTVAWTNGNGTGRIVVAKAGSAVTGTPVNASGYIANSSFSSGSTIAAGEYVVYSGAGSNVTVTSLAASTTYYFAVFEDDGSTGCESYKTAAPATGNVTTSSCASQIPYMTSAVINACPGPCGSEGADELLFFSSGSYSIPVSPANMILTYGSNPAPTKVYNGSFTADATITANLNAAAGCAGFFIDAVTAGTIPANTNFLFTSDNYCNGAYDFSTLCASGYGPIYIIYVNAAAWVQVPGSPSGNYANAAGSGVPRYFRTDFSAVTGGGTSGITDYSYISSSLACDCDGASCTWGPSGGAPSLYITPNSCTFPMTVLPIVLSDFNGNREGKNVLLNWTTQTETDNAYFTLERSVNGTAFEFVAQIKGAGNSSAVLHYAYTDDGAPSGIIYYRLKQTDFNGHFTRSNEISVKPLHYFNVQSVYPNPATQQLNVSIEQESSNNLVVYIYNSEGKRVYTANKTVADKNSTLQIDLSDFPSGIYLLSVKGADTNYQSKFIKQ
ncbi:MAG: T9SS type A sorting domain-containing protein [Bacteroidia bacterium]